MPTDTERDAAPVRHPIAPPRLVGPLGLTRAGIEEQQAADVETLREAAPCSCRWYRDPDGYGERDDDPACPRHGSTAEARAAADVFRCECGLCEAVEYAHTVTWPTHSYRLCRVCSTCASCRRRAELVDGEVCEACDDLRTEQQEARAREGEWAAANPEAVYAPPSRF